MLSLGWRALVLLPGTPPWVTAHSGDQSPGRGGCSGLAGCRRVGSWAWWAGIPAVRWSIADAQGAHCGVEGWHASINLAF